jgi:GTP-binding protein HflX
MSAAEVRMVLKPEHGRARAWLHRNGEVLTEEIQDNGASLMTCPLEVRPAGAIPG